MAEECESRTSGKSDLPFGGLASETCCGGNGVPAYLVHFPGYRLVDWGPRQPHDDQQRDSAGNELGHPPPWAEPG